MGVSAADARLIARVAKRDPDAARELFDRFAEDIHRYLARKTSPSEVEDIFQEVFARALRRASSFRGDSGLRTWLHSIARYTLFEHNRARWRLESLGEIAEAGHGPESLALGTEERRRLIVGLEQLSEPQAIVFGLHKLDGLTHEEIAELLGIAPATSRKRLERAIAALREQEEGGSREPRHSQLRSWRDSLVRRWGFAGAEG